jgi:hypothetical protein
MIRLEGVQALLIVGGSAINVSDRNIEIACTTIVGRVN